MSYRSDMEAFAREAQKRKKLVGWVLKITILVLAATVLVAAVGIGITLAQGGFGGDDESGDDTKKPVIRGPEGNTQIVYTGEPVSYKSFVQVSDNSGSYELSVDNSQVNLGVEGTYTVTYTATDAAGNKSTYVLTVIVKNGEYSEQKLMALVEAKAKELGITKEMNKETQVRKIYEFVNDPNKSRDKANILFNDVSNTPNQQAQAGKKTRSDWESDWIEEAYRTLVMKRMQGDCYTYYAVSKAFFEYFEIENIGIQRSSSSSESGTHFWLVVNIGTEKTPEWYFYDATRLAGSFSDGSRNACLITAEKLETYRTSGGGTGFYAIDQKTWNELPTISTKELN